MSSIFHELFVLEAANNHWGSLARGLEIVRQFAAVVRQHQVRAAIKLQFRDVDTFIHKDWKQRTDIRYIGKTLATRMPWQDYAALLKAIRDEGCLTACTPFDERSVAMCVEYGVDIIKIASSDIDNWPLLEAISKVRKPMIASTGGASISKVHELVGCLVGSGDLALNHCVSLYPCKDADLRLDRIDLLWRTFPEHVIGFSTHECGDWHSSMLISYAKGARTWERHIDIPHDDRCPTQLKMCNPSPYCSTPAQISEWFTAFKKAREMCAGATRSSGDEIEYLRTLKRGVYAVRDLPAGHPLTRDDVYFAIPLQADQADCSLAFGNPLTATVRKDEPIAAFNGRNA